MSKSKIVLTVKEHEQELTRNFLLGRVDQLEDLARKFNLRAGDAFAVNADREAHWYRSLADEFRERASREREELESKYPKPKP